MNLLSLFHWLAHSAVGIYMQRSSWAFAVAETIHLIALATLGGTVLVVQLTTLGLIRRVPIAKLAAELFPAAIGSLAVLLVTGVLMVSAEALKCYYSQGFRAKCLPSASQFSSSSRFTPFKQRPHMTARRGGLRWAPQSRCCYGSALVWPDAPSDFYKDIWFLPAPLYARSAVYSPERIPRIQVLGSEGLKMQLSFRVRRESSMPTAH